ncbi:MAG: cupin domain-containing protein [Pseudonocardiaceae bacterium]
MNHRLVQHIEKALGWAGPQPLGATFAFGRRPDPSLCDQLLNPRKLLGLILRRSLTYPQLRCLQHGKDLHPSAYLSATTTGRGQRIEIADMRRLGWLLKEGATLVLDDVGPLDATLELACRALSWWAGEITRVNTYLTTHDASGWGLHWDSHDVLCVQLAGEKNWEVRGPSRPAPMERDTAPNLEPSTDLVWSGTMRPGDVLHIPRGWWHQATRTSQGDGCSLHATFGLTRRTGVDWLAWVADQARADELFRRDLHQHSTPKRPRHPTTGTRRSSHPAHPDALPRRLPHHPPVPAHQHQAGDDLRRLRPSRCGGLRDRLPTTTAHPRRESHHPGRRQKNHRPSQRPARATPFAQRPTGQHPRHHHSNRHRHRRPG